MKDRNSWEEKPYGELPDLLKECAAELGINLKDIGVDIGPENRNKTMWDINPQSRHKWHNLNIASKCYKCGRNIYGHLVIEKKTLKVCDSSNFMLFDEGTLCDQCRDGLQK